MPQPVPSPGPAVSPDTLLRLRYDALTRQLENARAAQARYETRFFSWMSLSAGTLLSFYLIGSTLLPIALALLPFLVITAGMQAGFILHHIEYARFCATALEGRLNQLLESDLLITAWLDDVFSWPLDDPKISNFVARPDRFHVAYSLHWGCVWLFFFLAGVLSAGTVLPEGQRFFYGSVLATWGGISGSYLIWQITGRHRLVAMEQSLRRIGFYPGIKPGAPPE